MNNGILIAGSGLRAQEEALDILANNLANLNTPGFKEQKSFFSYLNDSAQSAQTGDDDAGTTRAVSAEGSLNLSDGQLQHTQRDLDVALTGTGFLTIETPQGVRYTRNGSLRLNEKSELATADGYPVLGESGRIAVGPGRLNITEQGNIYVNTKLVGVLKLVTFEEPAKMVREGSSLMSPPSAKPTAKPANVKVKQGYLENSNVNAVASVVQMVGIMRRFESIQKSVGLIMNDLDVKSIERLGR